MEETEEARRHRENEGSSTHTNVPRTEEARRSDDPHKERSDDAEHEKRGKDGEFESGHRK